MRFINSDQSRFALRQHLDKAIHAKTLRGDEEELQLAGEIVEADLAGGGAVAAGVDAFDGETEGAEFGELIFHERDERADDEGGAAARDAGELVAEGFAGAGGHDEEDVAAFHDGWADGFLVGADGGKAEGAVEVVG